MTDIKHKNNDTSPLLNKNGNSVDNKDNEPQESFLNQFSVACSISTNILGVGILCIPYVIQATGLVLGLLLLFAVA